jgi:Uma2 family endonuclease
MTAVETPGETGLITGEQFAAMVDIGPAELVKERIVSMHPTGDERGGVELTVGVLLYLFVRQNKLGEVRSGEVGIYTGRNPDIVRGADVIFISNERYAQKTTASDELPGDDVLPGFAVPVARIFED